LKYEYWEYLSALVEHQICVRNGGTQGGLCSSSGLGDRLHAFVEKLDDAIDQKAGILEKAAKVLFKRPAFTNESTTSAQNSSQGVPNQIQNTQNSEKRANHVVKSTAFTNKKTYTGTNVPRLSSCGGCGGKRSFSIKGNNMGRATKLNRKLR
jgi:hypothetical protein